MNKLLYNDLNASFPCRRESIEASVKSQNWGINLIEVMDSRLRGNDGEI